MKFLALSLLAASAITDTFAAQCVSPIVSNGQCIGKTKSGFENADCNAKSAKGLIIKADGKLCFGSKARKCLVRSTRKGKASYRSAKKESPRAKFVIFSYDEANNSLRATAPNAIANKYPIFENGKLKFSDKAGDVGCTVATTAAPTIAATVADKELKAYNRLGYITINPEFKLDFKLKLTKPEPESWRNIILLGNSHIDCQVSLYALVGERSTNFSINSHSCDDSKTKQTRNVTELEVDFTLNEWHDFKIQVIPGYVEDYVIELFIDRVKIFMMELSNTQYCTKSNRRIGVYASEGNWVATGFYKDLKYNDEPIEKLLSEYK